MPRIALGSCECQDNRLLVGIVRNTHGMFAN